METKPQSLVFYNLIRKEKIKTLNNLQLCIGCLSHIIKINDNEVAVAGDGKVYIIDINNYLILDEINSDCRNHCILKLSNNLFLIGDVKGTISQFKIIDKKIIIESYKNLLSLNSSIFSYLLFLFNFHILKLQSSENVFKFSFFNSIILVIVLL